MRRVTIYETKTNFSKFLAEVEKGEELVVCRGKTPIARITQFKKGKTLRRRPRVGTVTSGRIKISKDAFSPMTVEELRLWGID